LIGLGQCSHDFEFNRKNLHQGPVLRNTQLDRKAQTQQDFVWQYPCIFAVIMKRLIAFTGVLALTAACSTAPQGTAEASSAKPAASTAEKTAAATTADASVAPAAGSGAVDYREVTLPAGTVLPVDLETSVGSDISRPEQPVQGRLRAPIRLNGIEVLPAGTAVSGHVTTARRPGRVKGRGLIAMRFTRIDTPGAGTAQMRTATISRLGPATKQQDALKIVAPAAAGAVIGRVAGGKDAARKGAVIGGAAGTGYVLSTRGKEVRLGKGANLSVRLTAPLTVRVPR
jgi:hypothetical protein